MRKLLNWLWLGWLFSELVVCFSIMMLFLCVKVSDLVMLVFGVFSVVLLF